MTWLDESICGMESPSTTVGVLQIGVGPIDPDVPLEPEIDPLELALEPLELMPVELEDEDVVELADELLAPELPVAEVAPALVDPEPPPEEPALVPLPEVAPLAPLVWDSAVSLPPELAALVERTPEPTVFPVVGPLSNPDGA